VVDDETSVTDLITYNLRKALYEVQVAANGRAALRLAREYQPDLILLDMMIPEVDGLDVCRELRKSSEVPVIMITARGEELDRVLGLEIGADNYVTKPFSVRELMARIKAVLRRAPRPLRPLYAQKDGEVEPPALLRGLGNLSMDVERRSIVVENIPIELTRLEFDLLHRLLINPGRVLTRD
jgi:DNA-binding response OmpR family regulator